MNKYFPSPVFQAMLLLMPALAQASTEELDTPVTVIVPGQVLKDGQRSGGLATGSSGSVMDIPFAVNSVPADRIREQAGTTLQDALRNVPGAQADSGFNGSHTQFFILRGAVADSGTGSNRVLRDGVRLSNYPYVPAFIESVDVLRGPGSALGVRSEPGGTVNIVTRQPFMENAGSILASAGEHSARELTVDLNRVLSEENETALRIIATRSESSEWRHVPDKLDGLKLGIAKGGNGYRLQAGFEATNQTYQPDYGIPAAGGRPVAIPLDRQLGEPFADSTTNNRIADLHGDFTLGTDTRLTADITHLTADSTSVKNVLTGSPLPGAAPGTYARSTSWEPDTQRRIDSAATSLTTRQQIGTLTHNIFLGLDYYRETLDQPTLSLPASASPGINVYNPVYGRVTAPPSGVTLARSHTSQNLKSLAASVQDQLDAGDWSAVVGARYTDQEFVYGMAGARPVTEARWSPKFGLLYRPSDAQTIYANVASGISPNQVASSSNQSLPSRTARQAELGWKALWLRGAVVSDIAVYRLKQTNMISSDLSTPNNFDFTVEGSARSRGLEASLTGYVTDRFNLAATYACTEAVYLQNSNYGGKRVPNVARQAVTLWGQYRWNDAWRTGAGIYAQGQRFADEANTTTLPGYARLDFTQTWARKLGNGDSLEVQLALRNVLDKAYYVSSHLHVSRWITPAEGPNVSLTASYRF